MNIIHKGRSLWVKAKSDTQLHNERNRIVRSTKKFIMSIFRLILIVGIAYVIISPLIGIVVSSFFSNEDQYSPLVYLIPQTPTLERYQLAITRLDYFRVMGNNLLYVVSLTVVQLAICSMVGYGFARFNFPFKRLLFGCVIVMIVLPAHTIMLPLYMTFRNFDPLWLFSLFGGEKVNLLSTPVPLYLLSIFGTGLRSGLYIYIFNQFFRGLPKEIEEASFVDGGGTFFTFLRVMIPNAIPSIITVTLFSLVWQYNDLFYANAFNVSDNIVLSKRLNTLGATIANRDRVVDPNIQQLYVYAGIVLMILPMVIIYVFLQRRFIEGVERSGIVG
ncbi:MAG: carbohydrate ABC transporter permease [Oscillospiraceae bacterium]|nr:carbohydrate ABC transporter permease [Oscillospiraceae bacterium]